MEQLPSYVTVYVHSNTMQMRGLLILLFLASEGKHEYEAGLVVFRLPKADQV